MKAATFAGAVPHDHDCDLELAQRHCAGDPGAFDEVYARYAAMVYNLALRLAGDADEAADLTQEVFLRVHRGLGGFSGRSALKTWIFRVALNHCRERLSRFRPILRPIAEDTNLAHDGGSSWGHAGAADDGGGGGRGGGGGWGGMGSWRAEPLADPGRDPEALAIAADCGRQVAHGLALLPPAFREAVVLRDLQGLSYQEIAAVLQVRVGTVRSRIARGREQLRIWLDQGERA